MITDAELIQARQLFPLPDHIQDTIMNRSQTAHAFDVSENTVSKWVKLGMPVAHTGQRGTGYQFQPSDCWAWRKWQDAAEQNLRKQADGVARAMRASFRNVGDGDDKLLTMSPKEIKEEAEAEKARINVAAMRREYVHSGDVNDLLEDLFMIVRNNLETLPDYAELELSLTPEQVLKFKGRCDEILIDMKAAVINEFGTKGLPI